MIITLINFQDSWASVFNIINHFGKIQDELIPVAGPGNFHDPDMVRNSLIQICSSLPINVTDMLSFGHPYTNTNMRNIHMLIRLKE